jgi:hypothetical protein
MKRVLFSGNNNDYKKADPHISDPLFIPLCIINDLKSQKNGTKKTVFWVKKKKKQEDGTVSGEKWSTSQQYIGDWKDNKKHGYGIKIYSNKDKYEGYWDNDLRNGKGTYWLCIGKNKYRKLYTGDWKNNKKEGHGIYFYKDGSCYDGQWKNNKREGKGLMIYSNEDIYEGHWLEDKKNGYGILEKQNGDKYYGFWNMGLKEGQGYYYYYKTAKIYLGEWHEDNPRCGIFTDVEDDTVKEDLEKITDPKEIPSDMPELCLDNPEAVLEDSINQVHFIRNIKLVKNKNLQEIFGNEEQKQIIKMYSQLKETSYREEEIENKIPDYTISIGELQTIIYNNLSFNLTSEILEVIFYALGIPLLNDSRCDFLLFCKIFYLISNKINGNELSDNYSQFEGEKIEEDKKEEVQEGEEEDKKEENNVNETENENQNQIEKEGEEAGEEYNNIQGNQQADIMEEEKPQESEMA